MPTWCKIAFAASVLFLFPGTAKPQAERYISQEVSPSDALLVIDNATTTDSPMPVLAGGTSGAVAITACFYHSLALKSDGTVWAWGHNSHGKLGDGTTTNRLTPVPVTGLTGAMAIACGYFFSLALRNDGTVWAWGDNAYGQLGDGTTTNRLRPVPVSGLTGVVAIAAGSEHSLALKRDGTVWAWGHNTYGQLGDGTPFYRPTPVLAGGVSGAVAIAAGPERSLALKSDGTVWAWGYNFNGELGDGTTTNRLTPVPVTGLTGAMAIACGYFHSLALRSDGTVWAWGVNGGRLGDGTTTNRLTPVLAGGVSGAVAIAAGGGHSLALTSDGTVWAWGDNRDGQLGDGTTTHRLRPGPVSGFTGVVALAAGYKHSLAVKSDGTVWAWGDNSYGKLGDGTTTNRLTPVLTSALTVTHPVIVSILNAADLQTAVLSPSTWAAIMGVNLAPTTRMWSISDFVGNKLPTQLDGVSVTINGQACYVYYISPTQINFLPPDNLSMANVQVQVVAPQGNSVWVTAAVQTFSPAFFMFGPEGRKYVAAVHADGTYLGKPNLYTDLTFRPAKPSEVILLFGTGIGPTNPPLPAGELVAQSAPAANPVTVWIGGVQAHVPWAGIVASGEFQLNVTVPDLPDGDYTVVAQVGGLQTQSNAYITVQR